MQHVARELNLVFPSSSVTAITIRSMHLAASGAKVARQQMKATLIAFLGAMVLRVAICDRSSLGMCPTLLDDTGRSLLSERKRRLGLNTGLGLNTAC